MPNLSNIQCLTKRRLAATTPAPAEAERNIRDVMGNNMAIRPQCDKCKKELKEFGAILLSPPGKKNLVRKFHLCKKCYRQIKRIAFTEKK